MEFRILGPLEVADDGSPLELGGPKQRALLALLLLEANRVVSADRLIDAMWEGRPPQTAQKALQVYVSQLRKLLGKERLATKAGGYVLRVEAGELDAALFEALHGEGRLTEALRLWRGQPLADFAYQEFAQAEIARLEELRLACLEERIERDLEGGRHVELIGELDALVAAHPHRERLRAQHMLALYRSGRQAEALEAYQSARAALVDELGIEPGRHLRELHQAILNQEAGLELAAPDWSIAPVPPAPPLPGEPAPRETRKTVSVLAVALSPPEGLDPEALRRVTDAAHAGIANAVEQHGGTIEAAGSDLVTAVFGLPALHEDDALRAVRAATNLQASELRLAIATGEVLAGDAPTGSRITGDPLTQAARRAQATAPGALLVDHPTYRLVRDAVVAAPADDGWRVQGLATDQGDRGRLSSPMVGRDRERRRLHDAFEQALGQGSCQLFTVLGLAGVGKSRLVQEFLADLGDAALVARGRCLPYGDGITFWPLAEAVREAVGLDGSEPPELSQARIAIAARECEDPVVAARHVAETIGLTDATASADERFGAVQALFESLAAARPLVLVFDDIHWGEATFLDLVERLAERIRGAPILLVCLARPELLDERPSWGGGKLNATTTLLEPLSDDECTLLMENLVGSAELADEVKTRIADAAEGNPLFVEEMLSMLIDDGLLVRRGDHWAAAGDIGAVRVPPTIHALLAARLDRLSGEERGAIERAAVVGKVFYEAAVAELTPEVARPAIGDALASLVRKELIRPERSSLGQRTFRFRHLLIRDAAYDSIPKEQRAELHARFARWLEQTAGERATEQEEVVGYHLEQAYRYQAELGTVDDATRTLAREAAERLGSAGRRAFLRRDGPAGVNLISRAVALLPAEDPLRVELIPNVRATQGVAGEMTWADRVLTEAVEAAATAGDRRLAAHALVQRGFLRLFTAPDVTPGELIETAERAIAVFEQLGDELGLARAMRLQAQAHYLARRAGKCAEVSERALVHARLSDDRFEISETIEWLAIALALGPTPAAEAAERCRRLVEEAADDPALEAGVICALADLEAMLGDLDKADELRAAAHAIAAGLGEQPWLASMFLGDLALWRGDALGAESELRPAYDALGQLREKSHFSSTSVSLSRALADQGRYDEAEQLTREAEEASRLNDVRSQILWRATRAKILARRGQIADGERLARDAVAFAAASDFHQAHAEALMDLAEVLELAGERSGAAAAVEEAIVIYDLKGNVLARERAGTWLASLSEAPQEIA